MASTAYGNSGSRSSSASRGTSSSLPGYSQGGLSDDFINIEPAAEKQASMERETQDHSTNYMPPPYPPPGRDVDEHKEPFFRKHRVLLGWIVRLVIVVAITAGLVVLNLRYQDTELWTQEETPAMSQKHELYAITLWLLVSWCCFAGCNVACNAFPYIFWVTAGVVNRGQQKYWRIFFFMSKAVTYLGGAIGSYVSFTILVLNNSDLILNAKKDGGEESEVEKLVVKYLTKATMVPASRPWPKVLNDFLTIFMLWSVFFFVEQLLILYISIHYHYRSDGVQIQRSKRLRKALTILYEASAKLNPPHEEPFIMEDKLISRSKLKMKSAQKTVDTALEDTRASAALAKRVWMSFVPEGRDVLTVEDIVEVIKAPRRGEAEECFETLDENQNGDLTLSEMVLTVIEAGRSRRSIYKGMTDINRALNTLDWIFCVVITTIIAAFTLMRFVKMMKGLKDALGVTLLGLSFGFGRTLFEFLNGCIFIFLKHAYDVGDRIEVYNIAATIRTSVVVEKISILYTVFRRVDNGKELQMSNDRLNMKRIENLSRSGPNREEISVYVDFNTTFTDIENLKAELQAFVSSRANSRDYQPRVEIRLNNIFEMNKLELITSFTHKSNWANEDLRMARSSKFKCALVAAVRKIPLSKPGGLGGNPAKNEEFDQMREDIAYGNFTMVPVDADASSTERSLGSIATGVQINSLIGQSSTGLRHRPDPFSSAALYGP